jgi:hypothetical protein
MSTRGTVYFEIKERPNEKPDIVHEFYLSSDAYYWGFGSDMYERLENVCIDGSSTGCSFWNHRKKVTGKRVFKNIEGAILYAIYGYGGEYLKDDEYVYRFIFTRPPDPCQAYSVAELVEVEAENDGKHLFYGTLDEFGKFCNKDDNDDDDE